MYRLLAASLHLFTLSLCIVVVGIGEARPVDEMATRQGPRHLSAASDGDHTCFVRADANVLCWGNNASGQIGDGTSGNTRNVPTLVAGVTFAIGVAVGRDHSCALLVNGVVRCWGSNALGQLGVGAATTSSASPVEVLNVIEAVALAAGRNHTCARRANGTVQCWGENDDGQLGDGTRTTPRFTPVLASNLTDAVKLAAGDSHTCAVRGGGFVSCWGLNNQGQLGTGDTSRRTVPTQVVDIDGVVEIAAGLLFTCAVKGGDGAFCWGDNNLGQLGTGTASNNSSRPVASGHQVNEGDRGDLDIAAGQNHACEIRSGAGDDRVFLACWGGNDAGQLGIGIVSPFESLPRIVDFEELEQPVEVAAGRRHGCTLAANDTVRCWGSNAFGQLGNGGSAAELEPVGTQGLAGSISARRLAAGTNHSCAIRSEGAAACWGRNDGGAVGDGTTTDRLVPTAIAMPFARLVLSIAGGGEHNCATTIGRTAARQTACWGDNRERQAATLADPNPSFVLSPKTSLFRSGFGGLAAGLRHSCMANATGVVDCGGDNATFQLGTSDVTRTLNTSISPLSDGVAVAAGGGHSCALRGNGRVACWGANGFGQLGDGTRISRSAAVEVAGIVNAVSIATVRDHSCALLATGVVVCWGRNDFGQVDGTLGGDRLVPTAVTTLAPGDAVAVTTGFQHTCIVTPASGVRCWGRNNDGQLGDNSTTDRLAPVAVRQAGPTPQSIPTALVGVVGLVSDAAHNCALRMTGQPFCWGRNPEGQLGDNTRTRRLMATGVGSFTANIAREAQLAAHDRIVEATLLLNCPEGERFTGEIVITQASAHARRRFSGACTGGLHGYPVRVPAQGRERFAEGAAAAEIEVVVHHRGEVTDEQHWTRNIVIGTTP